MEWIRSEIQKAVDEENKQQDTYKQVVEIRREIEPQIQV